MRALPEPEPALEHLGRHLPRDRADALLVAAGRGDHRAFGVFYDRTVAVIYGALHRALGDPARTAVATEQVYVRLWRSAPQFDPAACSAYSRLLTITRCEAGDRAHA